MLVRAITRCFVDNGLREVGTVFDYNGPPNGNLKPVKAEAAEESRPDELPPGADPSVPQKKKRIRNRKKKREPSTEP